MKRSKRIIIGGGGTGGHVFPGISIAQALKRMDENTEILFVGARNKMEMERVPKAGFEIIGLPVAGFQRKLTLKNLSFFLKLWQSIRSSKRIIEEFKPDIAVGVGGYASGPILRAASSKGIPVVIQEQNSYAGVTNRILSRKAEKIFVAYENMEKWFPAEKIMITGNPVRQDILQNKISKENACKHFGLSMKEPVILVTGGSLGSRTLNNSLLNGLERLSGIQLIWQTGKLYYDEMVESSKHLLKKYHKIFPFISEMDYAFSAADLIVSRAGAGSISELAIIAKPVILVPSPNVAEDHQTKNAMYLEKRGAAIHIKDSEAEDRLIQACLDLLGNENKRKSLAHNLSGLARKNASDKIAKTILNLE